LAVGAVLLSLLALSAPQARAAEGPPLETPPATLAAALHCPDAFPHTAHEPVLLVHGTFSDADENYGSTYVPALTKASYDVCTVDLPNRAMNDIQISTEYVVFGVREIFARSGRMVDLLGVSQGGLQPRWAVKWWPDVQAEADDIVMHATPNHGTGGHASGGFRCFESCWQMMPGSNFLDALNRTDETPGAISYTSDYTQFDELVEPNSTSMLQGASNILIQDICPGRPDDHIALSWSDAVGYAIAVDAFSHPGPADPARIDRAVCMKTSMDNTGTWSGQTFQKEMKKGFAQANWVDSEPPLKPYAS
jgi:triacylglycerol lipase